MIRRIKTSGALALGAALAVTALAACGTTDPDEASDPVPTRTAATSTESTTDGATDGATEDAPINCDNDDTTTATGPVKVTDALGREVTLDKPAERIVALEWQQIEDVLSLCLVPVAVADIDGYTIWDTAEPLPDGVKDVGVRGEPNLDALFSTNPDLVIIEPSAADDPIIEQLSKYDVPVLATAGADASDPIAQMKDTFTLIAQATGRVDYAERVLEDFDTSLADAKAAVADADPEITSFVYFDGWIDGGNVAIRPFGQGSLVGELGEELGLTNAWTEEVDAVYGLGQTDIEGMTTVGDATFLHTGTQDVEGDDIFPELAKNSVWAGIPAVAEGRVHGFPPGIWTFGGPRSSQQVIDAYVDLLTQ